MPGPMPKDPGIRQRRNKTSSRALLPATPEHRIDKPSLPRLKDGEVWHPQAKKYWDMIWDSPMSAEFVHGDEPALFRLVYIVNLFWTKKKDQLAYAGEIRLMEREFGLTPLSRRRLEWTVAQSEEAKDSHEIKRAQRAKKLIDGQLIDPREVLDI